MSENIIEIHSSSELTEKIEDEENVLLDFYADWCGPCKMMEPVIENISENTEATVVAIDVDENQDIAGEFGVRGVPTYAFVVDGDIKKSVSGAQSEEFMEQMINNHKE